MVVEQEKSLMCNVNHSLVITISGLTRTIHMYMYACKQLHTLTHQVETGTFELVFFCLMSLHTEYWLRQVLFGSTEQSNSLLVWSVKDHDQLTCCCCILSVNLDPPRVLIATLQAFANVVYLPLFFLHLHV